jgi:hypothetical protein
MLARRNALSLRHESFRSDADQEVITWSGVEQVSVLTAEQTVVAGAAVDDVVARAGQDLVVAVGRLTDRRWTARLRRATALP